MNTEVADTKTRAERFISLFKTKMLTTNKLEKRSIRSLSGALFISEDTLYSMLRVAINTAKYKWMAGGYGSFSRLQNPWVQAVCVFLDFSIEELENIFLLDEDGVLKFIRDGNMYLDETHVRREGVEILNNVVSEGANNVLTIADVRYLESFIENVGREVTVAECFRFLMMSKKVR